MKDNQPKNDTLLLDELLIDELVAGQLTGERYRAVLRAIDAQPSKWRDCALAFLEEHALRSELRAMAQGTIDWSSEGGGEASGERANTAVFKSEPAHANKLDSSHPALQASGSFRSLLSLAALILVSFTVGWLGSEVVTERNLSAVDAGMKSLVENQARSTPEMTSRTNPELTSEMNPALRPKMDTQFVVDHPGALDRGIPIPIRELERSGRISVKTFDMLVPTTLNDGSPALVPVQEMILSRGRIESY
jgi:hypothetical protein